MKLTSEKGFSPICESTLILNARGLLRQTPKSVGMELRPCVYPKLPSSYSASSSSSSSSSSDTAPSESFIGCAGTCHWVSTNGISWTLITSSDCADGCFCPFPDYDPIAISETAIVYCA